MQLSATHLAERERTAQRLLRSSANRSFDPLVEIDWDAPLVDGLFFLPEHRVSLYGTPLWAQLSQQQRIELSRHEVASVASVGIWFEMILMQLLIRHAYDRDPTTAHVQYALTEIADECRHSVMFARLVDKIGAPAYGTGWVVHQLGRLMKTTALGVELFAAALIAEEILDTLQREMMDDESIQPVVRAVNRIHVIEEARHVGYARSELSRLAPRMSPPRRTASRAIVASAAFVIADTLIHPDAYAAVGLDPREARRVARANPYRQQTLVWSAARLSTFFTEMGLIGGPSRRVWQRAGLLG